MKKTTKLIITLVFFYNISQELVSSKNANRLKKRLCIAIIFLVVIGGSIAALIHFGAIKPTGVKSATDRLSGGYEREREHFCLVHHMNE